MQIFDFFHFFQTSLFRSKKHSFLFRISKNNLLWLDFPKKPLWKKRPFFYQNHGLTPLQIFEFFIWENGRFFDKNHGLTPLQIFDFLHFIQTLLFQSKKHSFLSRMSKNDLWWLDFPKKTHVRKRSIFCQKPWTNPFENFRFFWTCFILYYSGLKIISISWTFLTKPLD